MASGIEAHSGFIVLVDISGYTRFIMNHKRFGVAALERRNERVVEEHAEAIISVLLEAVIDDLEDILVVNKLEGDAALFYVSCADSKAFAPELVSRLRATFGAFNRKLEALKACDGCLCEACGQRGDLRIKIVAHAGEFMIKPVARFEELAGEAVIFAHRLLKNEIPSSEYLALTHEFARLDPSLSGFQAHQEIIPDFGSVTLQVFYPHPHEVRVRRLPLPWPWQTWKMARFFAQPRSRRLLEAGRRAVSKGLSGALDAPSAKL
jgi:hypothetical protein